MASFRDENEAHQFINKFLGASLNPEKGDLEPTEAPEPPAPGFHTDTPEQRADIKARGWKMESEPEAKPVPVIEKRPESPEGPDELAATQDFARRRRRSALLGMAGSNFADAFSTPSARTSNSYWEKYAASGDQAVADLKSRKAESAAREQKARAEAEEKLFADPNSAQSKMAVELVSKYAPSLAPSLEGKSAKDISKFAPWVTAALHEEGQNARIDKQVGAKKEEQVAKESELAKGDQAWRDALVSSHRYDKEIAALGSEKFKALTMKTGQDLQNAWEADKTRYNNLLASNSKSAADELAREAAESRAEERQKAKEAREAQFGLPEGFEAVGHPTNEQKGKFAAATASAEKMRAGVAEVRALLKKTGGISRLVGSDARALDRLVTQLAIEGKNVAELGALSGPDYALMNKLVQNPTELVNLIAGDAERAMDDLESWADRQIIGGAKAYGIRKKGQAPSPVRASGAKPAPGPGWKRGRYEGKKGWVSPDLTEFEAD